MTKGAEEKEPLSDPHARETTRKASGVFRSAEASDVFGDITEAEFEFRERGTTPDHSAAAWSSCTNAYDAFAMAITSPFAEDAVRLVRLGPGSRVLDVAAGTGAFAIAAAKRGANVLATDFSYDMLDALKQKARELELGCLKTARMDGQALAIPDATFDVAASLFGLMFFPDHARGLGELLRVLKPGGQVVISTWAPPARVEMMRLVGEAVMGAAVEVSPTEQAPHWTELSDPRRLKQSLSGAGFQRVHVMAVTHVCAFEKAEAIAELLPSATPSSSAVFGGMTLDERQRVIRALVDDFHERQGDGPFAMTCEGLLAVATKPL